jgi:hypothetical protein
MSCSSQSLRVVIRIFESDVFVIPINIRQSDSTKSIPSIMSIMEDGYYKGHNCSSSDASDATVHAWVNLPDRCDAHRTRESVGKCQLFEVSIKVSDAAKGGLELPK